MFSGQAWGIFIGFVCGALVLPRLILFWLRRRRMARFMAHFATALEVIIRGVKAGLPVPECLKIVIREVPEPVRSEFILATEAQILGLTLAESLMRLADRVPAAETRFFAILMTIQQRSGGNLVEALSNLVHVLRARKRIVDKIQAMSAEAKASAGIIGLLPFCVAALVYVTSPGYLDMLWTTHEGNIMLAVALIWMLIGILIMRRMISFDF
jgi:tight adherence protein B